MTSPELPFVTNGMIWDGVTEYQNLRPPEASRLFLLRMYGDGTRRFSQELGTAQPMDQLRARTEFGWETIGVCFENPPGDYHNHGFLAYDGSLSLEPVNQLTYLNPYKSHAARAAHQLNIAMGSHTFLSADERDRLIVHQTLSAFIGSAARRYLEWGAIDPEQLIVGGTYDGTPLWKHHARTVQDYTDIDAALCGQCDLEEYAQEFYFEADLPAFRRVWRQGLIYVADRSTTPWSPVLFDAAPGDVADFHDALDESFHKMLRHYAQVVAVQDRPEQP